MILRVSSASPEDVEAVINASQKAFESGVWSKAPVLVRSKVLSRLARILESRLPEMAKLESLQTGRTIREMNAQLGRLPEWMLVASCHLAIADLYTSDYYAALIRTHQDIIVPTHGKLLNYIQRVPLGVVAQITVSEVYLYQLSLLMEKPLALQSPNVDRDQENSTCSCCGKQRHCQTL